MIREQLLSRLPDPMYCNKWTLCAQELRVPRTYCEVDVYGSPSIFSVGLEVLVDITTIVYELS